MKPSLLFATLSLVLASPQVFAKTELELLRARCREQERQIQQLEEENARLLGSREARPKSRPIETVSAAIAPSPRAETVATSGASIYKVRPGDSWTKISRLQGISIEQLAKANKLKSSAMLHPGQELKVPGRSGSAAPATAASKSKPAVESRLASGKTHELRQGETFSSISKKYGISVNDLIAANPTLKPTRLRPGQTVNLSKPLATSTIEMASSTAPRPKALETPAPSPARASGLSSPVANSLSKPEPKSLATPPTPPTPAFAPEPVAKKETSSPSSEGRIQPVIIEGEITYGEFAAKHGTDADRLNALNGLDLTTATILAKGSELYVPAQP
jgi:LysM repeat protein